MAGTFDGIPGGAAARPIGAAAPRRPIWWLRVAVPAVAAGLFVVSLGLPALTVQATDTFDPAFSYSGLYLLVLGWLGPLMTLAGVAWFATPLFLVGLAFAAGRLWWPAAGLSALAIGLAAVTYSLDTFELPGDVPPYHFQLVELGPGFSLWFGAMVLALAGSLVGAVFDPGRRSLLPRRRR